MQLSGTYEGIESSGSLDWSGSPIMACLTVCRHNQVDPILRHALRSRQAVCRVAMSKVSALVELPTWCYAPNGLEEYDAGRFAIEFQLIRI